MTDFARATGPAPTQSMVAMVTGGARGIGLATAQLLAADGIRVVVVDRDAAAGEQAAVVIRDAGGEALPLSTDVSREEEVAALFEAVGDAFGRLDILVNNAAALNLLAGDNRAAEIDTANWRATFDVNVTGTMLCTRSALRLMLPAGRGAIVNCSSVSSLGGEFGQTAYGASKAAINQFTRAVATQYGRRGIRCNAVAPGLTQTRSGRVDSTRLARYRRHHATAYLGEPTDIARAITFLATDAGRFVTGQLLTVDGGATSHLSWAAEDFAEQDGVSQ
jgi:NAD(P)-dependent dehydrogenase (short-subunit alcohol dehydrogenase family)